jgi:hypothetical protein
MRANNFSVLLSLIASAGIVLGTLSAVVGSSFLSKSSYAQTLNTVPTTNRTFRALFDTFVVPGSVGGYGVYQAHNSSIFKPGENILLYVEPAGYSYKQVGSLFTMNFTADVLISDKAGHILGGFQNLPISTITSHHKNKELILTVSLTQNNPFPPGNYILKYTVHDVPSRNSFDILKSIMIS